MRANDRRVAELRQKASLERLRPVESILLSTWTHPRLRRPWNRLLRVSRAAGFVRGAPGGDTRELEDIPADLQAAHGRADVAALRAPADELQAVDTREAHAAWHGARGRVHGIAGDRQAALDWHRRLFEIKTDLGDARG